MHFPGRALWHCEGVRFDRASRPLPPQGGFRPHLLHGRCCRLQSGLSLLILPRRQPLPSVLGHTVRFFGLNLGLGLGLLLGLGCANPPSSSARMSARSRGSSCRNELSLCVARSLRWTLLYNRLDAAAPTDISDSRLLLQWVDVTSSMAARKRCMADRRRSALDWRLRPLLRVHHGIATMACRRTPHGPFRALR